MLDRNALPLVLLCMLALAGCASRHADDVPAASTQRNNGNGTVRAAIYIEAAPNVAAVSAKPASDRSTTPAAKASSARNKPEKRTSAESAKDNKRATAAAAAPPVSASSDAGGRVIAQHVPLSASGFRYTYSVELDAGGSRTFGFASDQGLSIGDRVLVKDSGVVPIPK